MTRMSLQKGLVGHWTMDSTDTDGSTLYDSSGHGNHGTLKGSPTTGQQSIIGESYSLDGGSDYIDIPNTNITPTDATTCSIWAKSSGGTDNQTILLTGRDNSSGIEFRDSRIKIWTSSSDYNSPFISVTQGEWTNLCVSYESGVGGGFYQDGVKISSIPDGGDIIYPEFYGDSPTIGSHGGIYEFQGYISDCRIYNRALSGSEINQLYQMRNQKHTYI